MPQQSEQGFYTSEFQYTGGLDYDSALLKVRKGDAIGALNISTINTNGQGDGSVFEMNGNLFALQLPVLVTQQKIYSFSISSPAIGSNNYNLLFSNLNGSVIATTGIFTTTGVIAIDAAAFQAIIIGLLLANYDATTCTYTISGTTATFLLTVGNLFIIGFDYLVSDIIAPGTSLTDPVVVQEAIDKSLLWGSNGLCLPIGGIDYLGDLFLFSSCQVNTPQTFNIVGMEASLGGFFNINVPGDQTATGTGYIQRGFSVAISGVTNPSSANGQWLIGEASYNIISAGNTTFTLYSNPFVAGYVSGGTATTFINGYLSITENNKNLATDIWTTIQLLGTKAINSRFYNPIRKEINANKNNDVLAIYFTDKAQYPRIFEYTGPYMANGAIKYYNPLGLYTYEAVELETRNIINTISPIVKATSVVDNEGAVPSGNWRYTVQPLASDLTPGGTSVFSNPVNIYNGSFTNPSQIVGTVGTPSSMQVTVSVTDIPLNVYAYLNLIGINYEGDTETAYLIKRVPIPPDATSVDIVHTGLETATVFTAGFQLPSLNYLTAGTQTVCSNTLLYGDLTAAQIQNFTAFPQTWTHALKINTTALAPLGNDVGGFTLGEYQMPLVTSEFTAYMMNETYRFWACFELTTGGFTPLFWIDDIYFDLLASNRSNPFGNNRRSGNTINTYDLSLSDHSDPEAINSYIFNLAFGNIDTGYLIDGIPFNQLVKRIYIFRTDNEQENLNEVLGCGLIVRHVGGTIADSAFPNIQVLGSGGGGLGTDLFDNPFLFSPFLTGLPAMSDGNYANSYTALFTPATNWGYAQWGPYTAQAINADTPFSCSFYCPDWLYGQAAIELQPGNDSIFCYGQPMWHITWPGIDAGDAMDLLREPNVGSTTCVWRGNEIRLSGATTITADPYTTPSINLPLLLAADVPQYGSDPIAGPAGTNYCPQFKYYYNPPGTPIYEWTTIQHKWLYTSTAITNTSPVATGDVGLYYVQYYRSLGSATAAANASNYPNNTKFGSIVTGQGIPTGAYLDINENQGVLSVDVWGGDTFNQKSFVKLQVPLPNANTSTHDTGGGVTVVFFCQNRINYNMRGGADGGYPNPTPQSNWINDDSDASFFAIYDQGYTPRNPDQTLNAFDPALPETTDMPERIIFSPVQPQNAVTNNWRLFLPLSFYDLSSDKGAITNLLTLQGELFSLQEKALLRQFYNEVGTLNVGEATTPTQVGLGSGDAFNKPGIALIPNIGNSNNHGFLYGTSPKGDDVRGFIDTITQQVIIFTKGDYKIASLEALMRSFFFNNLALVTGDNPNLRNGITGVFDDKRKQFVWTISAINSTALPYDPENPYNIGDKVTYGVTFFDGIPQVWTSLTNANTGNQPNLNPLDWEEAPYSDNTSYNFYTVVYSLLNERFTTFLSPKPYFSVEYLDTYLTAHPNTNNNSIFEDNLGEIGRWYVGLVTLTQNGELSFVTNEVPEASKMYVGQFYTASEIPFYLLYTTPQCSSYLPNTDPDWVNENGDNYYNSIQNDTLTAPFGTPNEDTTPIYGNYLITQITFQAQQPSNWVKQVIYKVLTKFKILSRTGNK